MPGEDELLNDPVAHMIRLDERGLSMERLDAFEGPWGLYEQGGDLFLLTRPAKAGSPSWTLEQLTIEDNRIAATYKVALPTQSSQIVLLPGSKPGNWFIVDQGKRTAGVTAAKLTTLRKCTVNPAPSR